MARKEKKYHFIYKTTNLLNGKYYYGMHSTNDLKDGYMGSGKRLRYSINKHGKENHKVEIIEFLSSKTELINREKEIVNLNEIAKENCMNLKVGGSGGLRGLSDESLKKIREASSIYCKERWKNNGDFRTKAKENLKQQVTNNHKLGKYNYNTFAGKTHTEEAKKKMSEKKKNRFTGSENSQFGTCWIFKDNINKKIKKVELNKYICDGWILGRKI
jgi:hypothetical protein